MAVMNAPQGMPGSPLMMGRGPNMVSPPASAGPGAPAGLGGAGAAAALAGGMGGGKGGGISKLNPYYGQLNPQEQEAARKRAILGVLSGMAKGPGQGMSYGLGQLDDVVNTAYQRSEREKAIGRQTEQEEKMDAHRERTEARLQAAADRQAAEAERAEQRAREQMELARERMQMARDDQAYQQQQRERQQQQEQRLDELMKKYPALSPQEMAEFMSLGGRIPGMNSMFGLGGLGAGGLGGGTTPNPDDEIFRAGSSGGGGGY